jgi:hypothetical protein
MNFPTLLESMALLIRWISTVPGNAYNSGTFVQRSIDLHAFFMQSLALWMFVACDEDGKPMVKPDYDITLTNPLITSQRNLYEAAEQRVLFKGWELDYRIGLEEFSVTRKGPAAYSFVYTRHCEVQTINDFTYKFSGCLTPTASAITNWNLNP